MSFSSNYAGGGSGGAGGGMEPTMTGALAYGGASLLGQLMGGISARKRQERQAKIDAAQRGGEMQSKAYGQEGSSKANALAQLMNAYRDSLVR